MSDNNENKQINDSMQNNLEPNQNTITDFSPENKTTKKNFTKPIIICAIAAIVILGAVFVSFGNVFKSDTELVFSAYSNSFNKYLNSNSHKTFFNQIFDTKGSADKNKNSKFNFIANIAINKIKDNPYLNGAKLNLDMNVDQKNQECGLNLGGVFNNIEIPNIDAYFDLNAEECIFEMPSLASNKSFYVSIKELLQNNLSISNDFNMKDIFENSKNSYEKQMKDLLTLSKEINDELISSINMKTAEPITFNGHSLDTYKCVLSNDETKQILKNILPKIINNDFFMEKLKTQFQVMNNGDYSFEEFKKNINNNMNPVIDTLDIANATILAGLDGKDLIKLEITLNISERESLTCDIGFIGEKEPSDIFDVNFIYKLGEVKSNITFTDTTTDSDKGVKNSKIIKVSGEENAISIETLYNDSSNEFSGKFILDDNKNPITADFNGTIKNEGEFLDLNFKNISLKNGNDILADISFSIKTEEFKAINKKKKENAIDINKNPMELFSIFQNFM